MISLRELGCLPFSDASRHTCRSVFVHLISRKTKWYLCWFVKWKVPLIVSWKTATNFLLKESTTVIKNKFFCRSQNNRSDFEIKTFLRLSRKQIYSNSWGNCCQIIIIIIYSLIVCYVSRHVLNTARLNLFSAARMNGTYMSHCRQILSFQEDCLKFVWRLISAW